MKKVMLILMLGLFTFGTSSFKNNDLANVAIDDDCFTTTHILIDILYGGLTIDTVDDFNWIYAQCEMSVSITYPQFGDW